MKVRYSYLKQQFSNSTDLWIKLKKFVSTGDFTLGKELEKFEKNFAKLIGTKYAVGVNSGTDAIKLSLRVLNVGPGDEVITAANTFVAPVGAITEIGAKTVFVDCDDTFCMNVNQIEKKISKRTKAIVPVHFAGYMADMVKLKKISGYKEIDKGDGMDGHVIHRDKFMLNYLDHRKGKRKYQKIRFSLGGPKPLETNY